jgi:nucleotide-binding universal stress UspA family protein
VATRSVAVGERGHRVTAIAPITLATDSLAAAAVAARLAASLRAELVLVGIAPMAPPEPPARMFGDVASVDRHVQEQELVDGLITERLDQFVGALESELRARTLLTWDPVGAALIEAAGNEDADLVVVPIRREGGLAHLFHDRADRYVLHHSEVPVLVVPTSDPPDEAT